MYPQVVYCVKNNTWDSTVSGWYKYTIKINFQLLLSSISCSCLWTKFKSSYTILNTMTVQKKTRRQNIILVKLEVPIQAIISFEI